MCYTDYKFKQKRFTGQAVMRLKQNDAPTMKDVAR